MTSIQRYMMRSVKIISIWPTSINGGIYSVLVTVLILKNNGFEIGHLLV